jgi:hypothetical protein
MISIKTAHETAQLRHPAAVYVINHHQQQQYWLLATAAATARIV